MYAFTTYFNPGSLRDKSIRPLDILALFLLLTKDAGHDWYGLHPGSYMSLVLSLA